MSGLAMAPTMTTTQVSATSTTTGGLTSGSIPIPNSVILNEEGWPKWVRVPFNFMESEGCGPAFMYMVEWWTVLERCYHWKTTTRGLGVLWRNLNKFPKIADEATFAERWWKWWGGLQPAWRSWDSQGRPTIGGEGDWECLKKPGQNGMLIALLAPTWWRGITTDATRGSWEEAVNNVGWVICARLPRLGR
ncbi:hypothetical protein C8Q80DRAFT_1222092 [Daedaleopsis nitida]|nr:hypothetical protein C8Q80DRAFT_1222092 [Daedaleopsis nitida]